MEVVVITNDCTTTFTVTFKDQPDLVQEGMVFSGNNLCICIDRGETDTNFKYKPYFKVFNSKNRVEATEVARIYMDEPRYTIMHHDGKRFFDMTNAQIRVLDKTLMSVNKKRYNCMGCSQSRFERNVQ